MISKNNPAAWDQLLDMIAERVADDVLKEQQGGKIADNNRLHLVKNKPDESRNLRQIQHG